MITASSSHMDAVQCFWGSDPVAQKEAYERLVGGAILDLDLQGLTTLFLGCVFTQTQYKTDLRYRAEKNPHCPSALAVVKSIKKKFTLYYAAEKNPPTEMDFRLATKGGFKVNTEGWHPHYWAHYFSRLLRSTSEEIIDTKSRKALQDALDFACFELTNEQLYKRISDDLPVILFSGYTAKNTTPGHSAPILFWGPWLITFDSEFFLQFYLYDRQLLTQDVLQNVKMSSFSNSADYSKGFCEFRQTLRLSEHKKSDHEAILDVLNGFHPHVDGLCHWYSIEGVLLAFLLINSEGNAKLPQTVTQSHILNARASHSELIFLATLDRLRRYLSQFKSLEVIDVGRDSLWRRWIAAECLSQDSSRWATNGIWAQKCRKELGGYFQEIPSNRNSSQFFDEVLGVQVDVPEEELEAVARKGDWQTLRKWALYGVDLQRIGPSGKSPLEHLFATPSDDMLIKVLSQIKTLSPRETQAAAKYLAATNNSCEAHYLIGRGISCAEVDEQGFNVFLKMMGAAHYLTASIEHMARINGDYEALRWAYRYLRLQGVSMLKGKIDPSCDFVMVRHWLKWFQDTVGCEYEAVLDLTSDNADKALIFQRIQKGALTPLFFIAEGKSIGIVFYQGWFISICSSIQIHQIKQDEADQCILKAFLDDPQNQWKAFDEYFEPRILRLGYTLANMNAMIQKRYILGIFEGIYLAQDACKNLLTVPTTAEQLVEAICAQSEKHQQRQHKVSCLLMRQYAIQDDLPCQEVHFEVDSEFLTEYLSGLSI